MISEERQTCPCMTKLFPTQCDFSFASSCKTALANKKRGLQDTLCLRNDLKKEDHTGFYSPRVSSTFSISGFHS